MEEELRRENRHVTLGVSAGELYHHGSGHYFRVEKVCDISPSGVGLQVNSFLQEGEKVRLGFKRGRAHIKLIGHVAWCGPVEHESCDVEGADLFRMGIIL